MKARNPIGTTGPTHPAGRKPHPHDYTAQEIALVTALFPTASWPTLLEALPGRTQPGITRWANHRGIKRRAVVRKARRVASPRPLPKPVPGETPPPVAATAPLKKASNPAKHRPIGNKGLRPLAVCGAAGGGSIHTPNANAQKAAAKAAREAKKLNPPVTADMVRALGANHPARVAWTQGVRAGAEAGAAAFHQAMNQLKQAA